MKTKSTEKHKQVERQEVSDWMTVFRRAALEVSAFPANAATQQMEGAADVAVTESAVLSYTRRINISSKPS